MVAGIVPLLQEEIDVVLREIHGVTETAVIRVNQTATTIDRVIGCLALMNSHIFGRVALLPTVDLLVPVERLC